MTLFCTRTKKNDAIPLLLIYFDFSNSIVDFIQEVVDSSRVVDDLQLLSIFGDFIIFNLGFIRS